MYVLYYYGDVLVVAAVVCFTIVVAFGLVDYGNFSIYDVVFVVEFVL